MDYKSTMGKIKVCDKCGHEFKFENRCECGKKGVYNPCYFCHLMEIHVTEYKDAKKKR